MLPLKQPPQVAPTSERINPYSTEATNVFRKEYGCAHHFCYLCIYKLGNGAINSTSFIHVYDHVKVAKCQDLQSWAQQQKISKMFDGCGS
jgi:hypothetical protein